MRVRQLLYILIGVVLHIFDCSAFVIDGPFPTKQCGVTRDQVCGTGCSELLAFCKPEVPRSFLYTKPVYRSIDAQLALWHDTLANYCVEDRVAFQCIGWYQQSVPTKAMNRFFLFNDDNELIVRGDDVIEGNSNLRDVRAEWLGLPGNFSGSFKNHLQQNQAALWFEGKVDLASIFCHEFFERFWVGLAFPLQWIENSLTVVQGPFQNTSPAFPNGLVDALNNPALVYARFNPSKQRLFGPAEINLRVGTKLLYREGFEIGFYTLGVLALHHGAPAEFVFSPFLGNNGHWGLGSGLFMQFPINCGFFDNQLSFVFEAENIYFCGHRQWRTLDIKGKPWSRYILLNKNDGTSNIPATQVLTRKINVKPYNMVEGVGALRYNYNYFEIEFGYHVWARGRDSVSLHKPFPELWGIAGDGTLVPGTNIQATASRSTIGHQADNDLNPLTGDPTFIPIKIQDLDLQTASAVAAINHRIYLTLGGVLEKSCLNFFANVGGYVEIPQYHTSLFSWGVWGKLGLLI